MIKTLFSDMVSRDVFAYLDDLIICSKDADTHFATLAPVLLKLRDAGLKAKLTIYCRPFINGFANLSLL